MKVRKRSELNHRISLAILLQCQMFLESVTSRSRIHNVDMDTYQYHHRNALHKSGSAAYGDDLSLDLPDNDEERTHILPCDILGKYWSSHIV